MRIPQSFLDYAAIPVAFVVARWFQPLAVVAVILSVTLIVALRHAERLKSKRELWVVFVLLSIGLIIAGAFLGAVNWLSGLGFV